MNTVTFIYSLQAPYTCGLKNSEGHWSLWTLILFDDSLAAVTAPSHRSAAHSSHSVLLPALFWHLPALTMLMAILYLLSILLSVAKLQLEILLYFSVHRFSVRLLSSCHSATLFFSPMQMAWLSSPVTSPAHSFGLTVIDYSYCAALPCSCCSYNHRQMRQLSAQIWRSSAALAVDPWAESSTSSGSYLALLWSLKICCCWSPWSVTGDLRCSWSL